MYMYVQCKKRTSPMDTTIYMLLHAPIFSLAMSRGLDQKMDVQRTHSVSQKTDD